MKIAIELELGMSGSLDMGLGAWCIDKLLNPKSSTHGADELHCFATAFVAFIY